LQEKRLLQFGILWIACVAATASAQLRYAAQSPVILRDGAGATTFTVTNIGKIPLPLALKTGPFSDDTSQVALATPRVTFTSVAGAPLPVRVDPGASIPVQVNVSSMSGASVVSAPLLNGELELGKLHAVETDAPLNISISNVEGANPELVLTEGEDAVLTLKNNDFAAYPLDWDFQIGGKSLQSGELQLGPHGSSRIELTPTDDLYTWKDAVRPSSRPGALLLSLHGPPEVARDLLPDRTLQVNLLMRKLSPTWTSFWSHMFVMVVLLVGGLLSLIGNSVLPNILRKISLRRQVVALGERISSVSTRVDTQLTALLRLERKRLELLLKKAWAFSLSSVETLDEVSAGVDRLGKRLKVAERLDEMRRRLEDVASNAPPSVTDDIDSKLQFAASELELFTVTEEEVNAANGYMDKASAGLELLGNTEALSRMIAGNFRDLKVRQKFLPYSYYNDLKAALPGLFEMLNQPFDDFRNIPRQMLFAIDYGVAALQLAFDYAVMRESVAASVGSAPIPGQASGLAARSARDRLIAHQKELVDLLGTLSWTALRELRSLVQEMRENIYESDVLAEIATKAQAEIVLDPKTARPFEPVHFSIRFNDPRFNDAAAMRGLTSKWEFPGHTLEQNWKIYHFFQGNEANREEGPYVPVSVRVEGRKPAGAATDGKEASRPLRSNLSVMVELRRGERSSYSRAFAEAVRFLIAFGVALAALLAGALQELEKLDFLPAVIAILALGFAADSVKNLLSQSGRRTTA
jgi:hypothetical protein